MRPNARRTTLAHVLAQATPAPTFLTTKRHGAGRLSFKIDGEGSVADHQGSPSQLDKVAKIRFPPLHLNGMAIWSNFGKSELERSRRGDGGVVRENK